MITNIQPLSMSSVSTSFNTDDVIPLDNFLLKSVAENAVSSQQDKDEIMSRLQELQTTTDPAKLFDLQQRTSDYNLKMSLFSTLARKAVGAIETVVRA
ncbi:type III secretion system inner rod subunit SctI [Serratia liquefaciens]|uniref:type III secretion system inner rod subunit SctI n=1 Tax=Serratia liquefaciens TaxID=614 RepID=UPI002157895E|nr:type III secretion system inner rod subunit SctI [Serratia liquefaciens]